MEEEITSELRIATSAHTCPIFRIIGLFAYVCLSLSIRPCCQPKPCSISVEEYRFAFIHPSILQSINQSINALLFTEDNIKWKQDENKHTCRSVHPLSDIEAFPPCLRFF